jgi:hypothetical protein
MDDRIYRLLGNGQLHLNVRGPTIFVNASTDPAEPEINIGVHELFWVANDEPTGMREFSLKMKIESIFARKIKNFHHQWLGVDCLIEMGSEWVPCTLIMFLRPVEKESCSLCPSPKGTWMLMSPESFCGLVRSRDDDDYLHGKYGQRTY